MDRDHGDQIPRSIRLLGIYSRGKGYSDSEVIHTSFVKFWRPCSQFPARDLGDLNDLK